MATIKQIKVAEVDYDLSAKYWLDASNVEHNFEDLAKAITFIGTASTTAPSAGNYVVAVVKSHSETEAKTYYIQKTTTGTATEVAANKGDLFIIADATEEFLCTKAGSGTGTGKSDWAELGDETNFQLVNKTLTSSAPSTNATGSAGGQTATGSATITYKKSATVTNSTSAWGETLNTGTAGGATVTGTAAVSYTKADSATGSAGAHTHSVSSSGSYTPAGTVGYSGTTAASKTTVLQSKLADAALNGATAVTVVTGVTGASASGTTVVNVSYTHADPTFNTVTVLTGVTGGTASGTATVNKGYTHADPVFNSATVVTGVTAAGLSSATATSTGAIPYVESVTHTAASLTGTKIFNTDAIKSIGGTKNYGFSTITTDVMYSPTVNAGILSWRIKDADTQDAHTGTAASTASVGISGGGITPVTKYLKATGGTASGTTTALTGIKTAGGITSSGTITVVTGVTGASASGTTTVLKSVNAAGSITSGGTATVVTGVTGGTVKSTVSVVPSYTLTQMTFNTVSVNTDAIKAITGLSFTGTAATISVSGTAASAGAHTHSVGSSAATASGTATITIAAHSHQYIAPKEHTHTIELTDTSVTGTASVAVSAHTHDLSNHTHNVTTKN